MVVKNMEFDGKFKLLNGLYKNFVVSKSTCGSIVTYTISPPDGKISTSVQMPSVMDNFDEEQITRSFARTAVEHAKQGKLDVLMHMPLTFFCKQIDENGKTVADDDVFLEEVGKQFGKGKSQDTAAQKVEDAYLNLKKEIRKDYDAMQVQQHGGVDFEVLKNDYLENAKNVDKFFDKRVK